MASVSCVFIGEGNILLSSIRHVLTLGCRVKAVFSNTENVQIWCQQQDIPVHARSARLDSSLQGVSFDYLFSINNPRVLKEAELRLAGHLNVNYHDSLLPAYAGVNASAWALINGETRHGITLHVMEVGIDTGHVLEREQVPILPSDSALALNLRCVEAFYSAFGRLMQKITGSEPLVPQLQDSSQRSYYGLNTCPPNMGLLHFHQDMRSVHNLARALEYGHQENSLGSPKILTSTGCYLLVTNAETTQRTHSEDSKSPGTILDIVDNTLIVKTSTEPILLSLTELNGTPILARKFEPYALTVGSVLQSPQGPPSDLMSGIRKKEAFWRRHMQRYEPTMFLRQKLNVVSDVIDVSQSNIVREVTLKIFPKQVPDEIENIESLLLTSFISFMARICCTTLVHIGLVADKSDIPLEYKDLYADISPGLFEIELSMTIASTFGICFEAIQKYKSSRTFLRDMQYRYPDIAERRRETQHNLVIATPDDFHQGNVSMEQVLLDCKILIVLTLNDVKIFYNDKPNHDCQHIIDTLKHYPAYVNSLCSLTPRQILLDVEMLSPEEKAVLYPIPDLDDPEDDESGLFAMFEQQCHMFPKATALKTTSHDITYSQMEEVVGQLALLMEQNLPESYKMEQKCVGLHLPNSIAYVLSVMASFKVHCPFLPLPVDLPNDRLAFTLRDSKVTTIMTTDVLFHSEKFQALPSVPKVLFKYQTPDTKLILLQFEIDENDNSTNGDDGGIPDVYSFDNLQDAFDSEEVSLEDDCCYVMYTSGSTGKPKGVQVREPNVVNLARAQIEAWNLKPEDTTAQFASIGFDASISEILTALLSGGTLAVLQENERLGKEFVETLKTLQVNVITLTPSVLNIYEPRQLPTLRKIVTAGEACMSHIAFKWTQHDPTIKFFNAYGPTETTVCATIYEFCKEDYTDLANQELAIGTAVKGAYVYLLDNFMKPVPPEVVGEIYIGGAGVSGGYVGHAFNKNASRFIPNPLISEQDDDDDLHNMLKGDGGNCNSSNGNNGKILINGNGMTERKVRFSVEPFVIDESENDKISEDENKGTNEFSSETHSQKGKRVKRCNTRKDSNNTKTKGRSVLLYRTGDHAFQDKNGRLTFVGRLDDQVKIRGQRVDLSEIEQVILQHPKVEMAAVVKHRCPKSAEPTIAAFVAPTFVYTSELKEYLLRALPRYMIPTHIRKLKAKDFPTSINGKVNRRALEVDESVRECQLNVGNSHLNEAQLTMAKLWCRVLQMDDSYAYSLHRLSSFSELGGNSLHLVIMQRLIEDTFRVHLSFNDIGAADTIENFTDIIKRKKDMLKVNTVAEDKKNADKLRKTILEDSTFCLKSLLPTDAEEDDAQLSQYADLGRRRSSVFGESPDPLKILISGVTGFLGAFLLHELLEQSDCQVLCMVREKSEAEGVGRVVENLERYGLWRQSYFPRLAIVLSDVSLPRLGIAPDIYHSLCFNVDVVFINAAKMNFNTCYDDHRQANVQGTAEFLRFALRGKKKFLFLTSSLSVFLFPPRPGDLDYATSAVKNSAGQLKTKNIELNNGHKDVQEPDIISDHRPVKVNDGPYRCFQTKEFNTLKEASDSSTTNSSNKENPRIAKDDEAILNNHQHDYADSTQDHPVMTESDFFSDPLLVEGGYGQSKWASERLVLQALNHLPGGAIFRPARVSGRSSDGAGPMNDLFASCILGMQRMGSVPDLDFPFDLTPVDFCAKAMVEITAKYLEAGGLSVKSMVASSIEVSSNQDITNLHSLQSMKRPALPRVFHLFNNNTLPFKDLFQDTSLRVLPLEEWRKELRQLEDNPLLLPHTPFLLSAFWDRAPYWPVFDTSNTDKYVSEDTKRLMKPSKELLQVYKLYFKLQS
ncbi:uncharacterized protein [Littorina saxatilis]|uniref:formyltetrahydrofolate dehydrogenase n=1 Tax=Littorina saxatilis TaxID=31220 RepID=A0AAN9BEW1_9CAEN